MLKRIQALRDQYQNHSPAIDTERAVSYTKTYKETEALDPILRRAKSLYDYIADKTISIEPNELIVGTYGRQARSALICPEICWMWYEDELDTMATRPQDPYQITEADKEVLRNEVFPYWKGKSMEEYFIANMTDEIRKIAYGTGVVFGDNKSQAGAGEFPPGYGNIILKKGFLGIRQEAESYLDKLDKDDISLFDKRKYYESVLIICDALRLHSQRHAEKARKLAMAEKDETRRKELFLIADICEKVPYHPPETFREALQAVWFTQILLFTEENTTSFCIDRPDQYLYPFYKQDKAAGVLTDDEAQELLECLWIKMAEVIYVISAEASEYYSGYQSYHGLTVGGIDEAGNDASNELSVMALQCTKDLKMHVPTINVRIHKNSSDAFLMKVCELVEAGTGQPAIFFDETAMAILERNGVKPEDSWNWCVAGCVEPQIPGKTTLWDEGGRYSYATAAEWALSSGYSKVLETQLGLDTGDPRNFSTYEEFEDAVKKQLAYLIEIACTACQIVERAHKLRLPKPLRSLCVEGCLEKGLDVMEGGAVYNFGPGQESTGIADLADSLAAVRKLVYDDKKLTMDELLTALECDFDGHEDVRMMLINGAPKYGNDDDYVDRIAADFVSLSCQLCAEYTSIFGSKYLNGLVPVIANIPHGDVIWALPSGRKATEPLSDGVSPYMGYDKKGPTSVLKSVCKIDHTENGIGTLLNIKLNPDLIRSPEDKKNLIAFLRAESALGGYHVQFNVVKTATLLQAQQTPEAFRDLLVRVAGYSAYFVELREKAQNSIIARTENSGW
jgi:formate C-acetyltransferase